MMLRLNVAHVRRSERRGGVLSASGHPGKRKVGVAVSLRHQALMANMPNSGPCKPHPSLALSSSSKVVSADSTVFHRPKIHLPPLPIPASHQIKIKNKCSPSLPNVFTPKFETENYLSVGTE
jgi:hypothetical protein